ncbi:MAG: hypothetical protein ACTMIR_04435 [Cellulomonadaceae bacterium]
MTYGDASALLRDAIGEIVQVRRTRLRLGGAHGPVKAKAPAEVTRAYTELIVRFRAIVWDYPITALRTALPDPVWPNYKPGVELLSYLEAVRPNRDTLPAGRAANTAELGSTFPYPLVNAWKRAAVAAVAACERELPLLRDHLDHGERALLIRDASQIALALARLDSRYYNMPVWQTLTGRVTGTQPHHVPGGRAVRSFAVASTALRCETRIATNVTDAAYTLDRRGHRPQPVTASSDLTTGVGAAIAALGNAWERLHHEFPDMASMTATLRINRLMCASAHRLALAAGEPDLAGRFAARAATCLNLLDVTENVSGNLGRGQAVVADMSTANTILDAESTTTRAELLTLSRAFDKIDAGLSSLLQRGATDRFYFVTHRNHMAQIPAQAILRAVPWYVAITDQTHPAFLEAARALRPTPRQREVTRPLAEREEFRQLIDTSFRPKETNPPIGGAVRSARGQAAPTVAETVTQGPEIEDLEPDEVGLAL